MKFENLIDFLENRMRMSHIYQPLFIKSLVEAGGSATIRQLAHKFLTQDESQLLYYEKRIKDMPLNVLRNHGVVSSKGNFISLNTKKLSFEQRFQNGGYRTIMEVIRKKQTEHNPTALW